MRFILALCFLAAPAHANPIAQIICAPSAEMQDRLSVQYGSELRGTGIRSPESVMEVWASPRGDWTLVMAYADGRRCIVAMGENWEDLPQNPA